MKNIRNKILSLCSILLFTIITSCEKDDLSNLEDILYVRNKGADMPAYIYGNGSEKVFLIVLHGGPAGFGLSYRANGIKKIEDSFAVVYFDQRGCGMSQGQFSKKEHTINVMAEDIMVLVKVLQYKYGENSRFFLLGHSWGGMLGAATLINEDNQSYFKGWINSDGPFDIEMFYFETIDYLRVIANEQNDIGNNVEFWKSISKEIQTVDTSSFNWEDGYYINEKAKEAQKVLMEDGIIKNAHSDIGLDFMVKNNILTISWNRKYIALHNIISSELTYFYELENIRIPTLYLWGKYDLICPPRIGQLAYDKIGTEKKKFVFFEKSGHTPLVNEADKFTAEVIDFINDNK